jgi:DNA primase
MLIRQSEVFPYYRETCKILKAQYEYLKSLFDDKYVDELCAMRGYVSEEQRNLIQEMQLGRCIVEDVSELGDKAEELGLLTKDGEFILNDRYIIPVYDIQGNLVSMIGYYSDYKKYITVSSPYFSKNVMFFNIHNAYELSWKEYNGVVFLVEGIFDCLSLRSIGLPAIATMGSTVSKEKAELLKFFKKVVAIPDDDATGRKALNRYDKKGWKVPPNTTMVKLIGGEVDFNGTKLHCKDMDNFVSWYEPDSVREMLLELAESREEIEVLRL